MFRAFDSELIKLRRLWMVVGVFVPLIGFSIASVVAQFMLSDRIGPVLRNAGLQSRADLATSGGLAGVLADSAPFGGVIVVVLFATSFGTEYGWGTLRNLLIREPQRPHLLAGKFIALLDFVFVGRMIASVAAIATALIMSRIENIPWSAWFTSEGFAFLGGAMLNLMLSAVGWAGLGTLAAMALKAPGAAVGSVLALFPIEGLINGWWDQGPRWLPGELFKAVANGGTIHTSYPRALALTLACTFLALSISNWLFVEKDITA